MAEDMGVDTAAEAVVVVVEATEAVAAVADSEIAADEAAVVLEVEVVEGHHVVEGAWAVAHPEEAAADSVEDVADLCEAVQCVAVDALHLIKKPLDPVPSKISCQKSLLPRKISHKPSVRQTSRVQTVPQLLF